MEDKEFLVKAENINKIFKIREYKYDTLKERVVNLFSGKKNYRINHPAFFFLNQ